MDKDRKRYVDSPTLFIKEVLGKEKFELRGYQKKILKYLEELGDKPFVFKWGRRQ